MENVQAVVDNIVDIDQNLNDVDYLKAFAKNISENLNIKFVLIGHPVGDSYKEVQTDVVCAGGEYLDNFIYELDNTPCNEVLTGQKACIHENKLTDAFPTNELLKQMGVESYLGVPIFKAKGNGMSGILALIDDKPIEKTKSLSAITEALALKAASKMKSI